MTVTATDTDQAFNGDGATTKFTITDFSIFAGGDVEVYEVQTDGTRDLATITTDYTVTLASATLPSTFDVDFVVAPASGTGNVVVQRARALTQAQNVPASGALPEATIQLGLDQEAVKRLDLERDVQRHLWLDRVLSLTLGSADITPINDDLENRVFKLAGTLTANVNLIFPDSVSRRLTVRNATSGSFTVTVKNTSGTGIAVTQAFTAKLWTDGTEFYREAAEVAN